MMCRYNPKSLRFRFSHRSWERVTLIILPIKTVKKETSGRRSRTGLLIHSSRVIKRYITLPTRKKLVVVMRQKMCSLALLWAALSAQLTNHWCTTQNAATWLIKTHKERFCGHATKTHCIFLKRNGSSATPKRSQCVLCARGHIF